MKKNILTNMLKDMFDVEEVKTITPGVYIFAFDDEIFGNDFDEDTDKLKEDNPKEDKTTSSSLQASENNQECQQQSDINETKIIDYKDAYLALKDTLNQERKFYSETVDELTAEKDKIKTERDIFDEQLQAFIKERIELIKERDNLKEHNKYLISYIKRNNKIINSQRERFVNIRKIIDAI